MKYTHAGIDIELIESSGIFRATVGGERVTAPSLAGMKTKIDKANKFPQFTALVDKGKFHHVARYQKVVVVGIKRGRTTTYRGQDFWVTSTGEHISEVFEDSPESLATLEAYDDLLESNKKEKEALDVQHRAAVKVADTRLLRHVMPAAK